MQTLWQFMKQNSVIVSPLQLWLFNMSKWTGARRPLSMFGKLGQQIKRWSETCSKTAASLCGSILGVNLNGDSIHFKNYLCQEFSGHAFEVTFKDKLSILNSAQSEPRHRKPLAWIPFPHDLSKLKELAFGFEPSLNLIVHIYVTSGIITF